MYSTFTVMFTNMYVKVSAAFGVLGALLILLYFFTFYFLNKDPLLYLSTFDIALLVLCMALAMFYYRDKLGAGKMHFWEGLYIGFLTDLIGTLLSTVAIYVFIAFLDRELLGIHITELQNMFAKSKQQINEQFGPDAFNRTMQHIGETTAWNVALDIFLKKFFISLFATGFVAAVLRKN